ncbi:hypothetical protein HXX76_012201 [Chlamydomonas incerta]|uniref:PKD domain-containing protein n=1 Tax=Chlamydomonas incerta TaxID=51695 RepID=A0A835SM59_CHLIN|nr:hypothetical protein HXX76_012201 [Chlamydomonas incerta]|eukprot:KAG2427547.1 hypothetical protein HXX76_012201 [Chlamydomonas incerta]
MATSFPKGALVISSGDAAAGNCGANSLDYYTDLVGGGSDANLDALIPNYSTYDAVALEFDVTPSKDGYLVFQYRFGSDEYTEWVNTAFNDVFGFFIAPKSQPITAGHNVAIVAGTADTQVSINNVNHLSHSDIWTNNRVGEAAVITKTEADGYTNLLNTQGYQVVAGTTYRFKLAVADAGDQILDSWVWIGGETMLVDQKPNATATVKDPVSCANPFETLDSAGSYDPDPNDTVPTLAFSWTVTADLGACAHVLTFTGATATVDLRTLFSGATYSVTLKVMDDHGVEDSVIRTLTVPAGCSTVTVNDICNIMAVTVPSPSPPPPPPATLADLTNLAVVAPVQHGGVAMVACDGYGIQITAGATSQPALDLLIKDADGADAYYIWHLYDAADKSFDFPVAEKIMGPYKYPYTGSGDNAVTFDAVDLQQGQTIKKYRVMLCVTEVQKWDQGQGMVIKDVTTFVQALQCPIPASDPPAVIAFPGSKSPDSFTLECNALVNLDVSIPIAKSVSAAANGGAVSVHWAVLAGDGQAVWQTTVAGSVPYTFDGTALVANGVIASDVFYTIAFDISVGTKGFDNLDNWNTKMSVVSPI